MDAKEAVQYWRDQVGLLLASGAAVVILFAGWAVEHQERFDARRARLSAEFLAACGLLAAAIIFALFLIGSVLLIYQWRLKEAATADQTVLPQSLAVGIAVALSVFALLIAGLMSFAKFGST